MYDKVSKNMPLSFLYFWGGVGAITKAMWYFRNIEMYSKIFNNIV